MANASMSLKDKQEVYIHHRAIAEAAASEGAMRLMIEGAKVDVEKYRRESVFNTLAALLVGGNWSSKAFTGG